MKIFWIAVASFVASSFASTHTNSPQLPANALPVPLVRQATEYSCGPAALLGVLYYWQKGDYAETDLYKILHTTSADGTTAENLASGARTFELEVESRQHLTLDDLRRYLSEGITVIVDLQAWRDSHKPKLPWTDDWDDGHYVVVVAMDAEYVYAMDPAAAAGYAYMPLQEFIDRWHDEDKVDGKPIRTEHLGIAIRGESALKSNPGPLIRVQ